MNIDIEYYWTGAIGRNSAKFEIMCISISKFFFLCFFLCSKEHFSIFFIQYLGVTAGIKPAT